MNGLRTSLWRCRRLYEAEPENDHVSGPFFNFGRRHCLEIESLASLAARRESDGNIFSPKGRKPVRGAKESFLGAKDGPRVERNQRRAEANQFHRRAIPAKIGEIRMRIRLRRAEEASMPTGGRVKA